ncbi:gamma-glutamyltransferase [Sediminicurvatus halobius]|uniref:Glutathione hydrolase proenzyme n=1 Tax=Sediminicurvatus halobius TaxID=2182432 RepID=A0A2U2N224_9GAMM|nr:gamma-glutamyltransferase [Spiribacter halobius]PWG63098.1 gamma-glutamyltransferase [Spiribacter halobius]UEX77548.1 gamma-glutamyltransferase [Spiribacter halobius]
MRRILLLVSLLLLLGPASALSREAAVATAHPLATEAAREILDAGGNAFDAAVAASAALAVVEPFGSGLGGGGFWLLHQAGSGRTVMVDGREAAPGAATADMYLDSDGEPIPGASLNGPLAAGIPGEPAALVHIAERYGRLPLARSLAPAIRHAWGGFPVGEAYVARAGFRLDVLREHARAAATYLDDGAVPEAGWVLRQPALARTLRALAQAGHEGFYTGPVARELVRSVREAGGMWTLEDLRGYEVVERQAVAFDYRDLAVQAAALPSAGGVGLATMLGILEGYDLAGMEAAARIHLAVEAMRRAYRDRAAFLGDPDFADVPVAELTAPAYARSLRAGIDPDRATPSGELGSSPLAGRGRDTTHLSIVDAEGNRVAATLSINYPFGSGFVAGSTGVLLNDEMDDFAKRPGTANAYGLVGGEANRIEPGKRPLSSMTPTFAEAADGRVAVLGTPGGSRIITMVLLGLLAFEADEPPAAWVAAPRYHHQYLPDAIQHEPGAFSAVLAARLRERGHTLEPVGRRYGNMQAILIHPDGTTRAASDPRGEGSAISFVPAGADNQASRR